MNHRHTRALGQHAWVERQPTRPRVWPLRMLAAQPSATSEVGEADIYDKIFRFRRQERQGAPTVT